MELFHCNAFRNTSIVPPTLFLKVSGFYFPSQAEIDFWKPISASNSTTTFILKVIICKLGMTGS